MTLFDFSEVRALATDLGNTTKAVEKEADRVLERGALGVKNAMAEEARASHKGHARSFAGSISYDRRYRAGTMAYEIGPDKSRRQGALGNLLYFGSRNNAPTLDIEHGLIAEEPKLMSEMAKMLERVVDRA
ncbi:hypothetical protein ACTXM8_04685 [Brachybacterium alimentarium]|uniref:hypothetical protein n=1 Tax=Brachybacterium alimentarium TaxID=47845 RepID=UPI003FCF8E16